MMKKFLFIVLLLISVCIQSFAKSERLTIGNLSYYHFTGRGATVVRASKDAIVQKLEPLAEVKIDGVTYPVQFVGNDGNSTPSSFGEYLETAILPPSVEDITWYAFKGCSKLKELYLPDALKIIGAHAFEKCSSLTELVLPGNVETIGGTVVNKPHPAFSGMSSLKRYVSFGPAALDDKVGIDVSTDIYVIPDIKVSYTYQKVVKYIFSKTLTPMLGGAKLEINMNYDDFTLKAVKIDGNILSKNEQGQYVANSLNPETEYSFIVDIEYKERIYSVKLPFKTVTPTVGINFSKTQTTVTGTAFFTEDETMKPENIRVSFDNTEYTLDSEKRFHVTNLVPAREYKYFISATYKGKDYYIVDKMTTSAVTSKLKSEVTPTTIHLSPSYDVGDTEYVNDIIQIRDNGEYIDLTSNNVVGLQPETTYWFKHIIKVKVNDSSRYDYAYEYKIQTSQLTFETQDAVITSLKSVRLKTLTNASDATGFGFEWRRVDSPDIVPSSKATSPIVNGLLTGSLRNVNPEVYYKYRPFYEASSGKIYYGDWGGFFTGDANMYYEPELTTLEIRTDEDNNYMAEGFVIDGTDDIIEQGFEYYIKTGSTTLKVKSSDENKRVKAYGMHMVAMLTDLVPNSEYILRTYAITDRGITYGNEVNFKTTDESGINNITKSEDPSIYVVAYYNVNGIRKNTPHKGVNIVLYSDGSTRKVIFNNYR